MKILKKQFYTQPIFVLMNLNSADTIMASGFDGENFVNDTDII